MTEETVCVATFNAENLFARYRFHKNFNLYEIDGFTIKTSIGAPASASL